MWNPNPEATQTPAATRSQVITPTQTVINLPSQIMIIIPTKSKDVIPTKSEEIISSRSDTKTIIKKPTATMKHPTPDKPTIHKTPTSSEVSKPTKTISQSDEKQQPISLGQTACLKEDQGIVDKKVSRHFFALLIIAIIVFVLFYLYIKKKPIPVEDAEEYYVIDSGMETNDFSLQRIVAFEMIRYGEQLKKVQCLQMKKMLIRMTSLKTTLKIISLEVNMKIVLLENFLLLNILIKLSYFWRTLTLKYCNF